MLTVNLISVKMKFGGVKQVLGTCASTLTRERPGQRTQRFTSRADLQSVTGEGEKEAEIIERWCLCRC